MALGVLLLLIIGFAAYLIHNYDPVPIISDYLEHQVSNWLFIVLMLVLPILGIPVSLFLILVGIKFGIGSGLLLSALLMLSHMVITYFIVHSFLRDLVIRLMHYFKIPVPPMEKHEINRWQAFIFMLVPGLPYVVKNNLLAMTGIPLGSYIIISWTSQFGLSIPLILMGGAIMEMDAVILIIACILALAVYFLKIMVKRILRRRSVQAEDLEQDAES